MDRPGELARLERLLAESPVVGIVGARQVGKTTLARQLAARWGEASVSFFDLESPADLARLADPLLALGPLRGLAILDEIQRLPDLFPVLRVLVDRPGLPCRFLVLGSASPALLRQSAESLAGRILYHELDGFGLGCSSGTADGGVAGLCDSARMRSSARSSRRRRSATVSCSRSSWAVSISTRTRRTSSIAEGVVDGS